MAESTAESNKASDLISKQISDLLFKSNDEEETDQDLKWVKLGY